MIYCFDIDGTICTNTDGDYESALPINERIDKINSLYDSGNIVHFYTARGTQTGIDWRKLTQLQLKKWGVKYHKLMLGKPHFDILVDDKSVSDFTYFLPADLQVRLEKYSYSLSNRHFEQLKFIALKIIDTFKNGGKLFLAGNGGSFSQATHFGGELTGRFLQERQSLPAIVLGVNHVSMTAISNDYAYNQVFSREFEALCSPRDMLVTFSTSGASENIQSLHSKAKLLGIDYFSITSIKSTEFDDYALKVNSTETPIFKVHLYYTFLCTMIDEAFNV